MLHLHQRARSAGFTLIELAIVIFIIGLISAVALPQLAPLLIFSELEGQGRRLAHYGSAVIAEASLFGNELTVYIDLDAQEIYTVRLVYPDESNGEEKPDFIGMYSEFRSSGNYTPQQISEMLAGRAQNNRRLSGDLPEGFDPAEADAQMKDRFDLRHRQILYARAKNVKQDQGFLSEIGPLFEEGFELTWAEPVEEELTDPILQRVKLPSEVQLVSLFSNGISQSRGIVEIKITPLGLEHAVRLYLKNEDEDYFTVIWDPLTGRGTAYAEKVE